MIKQAAMFIAFKGFRDEEYSEPKKALEAAGIKVVTVSTVKGTAQGKFRLTASVDKTIEEINPGEYAALALVGGPGALAELDTAVVHRLFTEAYKAGKVIGAICISPVILAHAGLLRGTKATVFPDGVSELIQGGAEYIQGEDLVCDGRILTANGPVPAKKYGQALADKINASKS